jgi:diacylglycerol kinase family enzyme
VVLEHTGAADGDHFDLMIEGAAEGKLLTWRVGSGPDAWTDGDLQARRIADHRTVYLTYEGEISGGRGRVRRVAEGDVQILAEDERGWRVRFDGLGGEIWLPRGEAVPPAARQENRVIRRPMVLLNPGAGTLAGMDIEEARARVVDSFGRAGVEADVRFVKGDEIAPAAREALESLPHDALIAGGGDGTLNAVANTASTGAKPFGILPLGTHNHFAKDLGMPLDLDDAIAAVAVGRVIDLPVAEVNGRLFLNFSAIGLHPRVVRDRDTQREETGRGKWLAMFVALVRQLVELPVHQVTLSAADQAVAARTPSVIVCNNPHQMRVFGVENASVPDRGLLNVYLATRPLRRTILWLMIRALFGNIDRATPSMRTLALPQVRIDSRRPRLTVSVDGEVTEMATPLTYRIRPRPLRVIVPAAANENSEGAGR